MTRIRRITVVAAGLLGRRLLVVRRRLWWLGVPAAAMVVSAGLLATAPAASADTGVAAGVRLAQVGNDLLMAGMGSSGNIDVLYQPVGSSTWSEVTATAPSTLQSAAVPVAVTALTEWVGLREVTLIGMVAEGPGNSLNFWWQSLAGIGSGPWHQEVLNGPGTTFSAPSIVQIGSDVAVAAEGSGFQVQFWWQQIGAAGWNSSPISGGQLTGAPAMAALTSPSGTLGITWSDDDGDVYYAQQAPSQFGQPWQVHQVGSTGFFYGAATPSIAALNNNLTAITTIGDNHSLDSWMTPDPPSFVSRVRGARQ